MSKFSGSEVPRGPAQLKSGDRDRQFDSQKGPVRGMDGAARGTDGPVRGL